MDSNALTAQDVAKQLKISKNTVYELVKRGELNSYKVGRKMRFTQSDLNVYIDESKNIQTSVQVNSKESVIKSCASENKNFVICGQDIILDILASYIEQRFAIPALRAYIGSYSSLVALYQGRVQVASAHLWDGDTGQYNIPYVRRLLPGIPALIVHLTYRMQGFLCCKRKS